MLPAGARNSAVLSDIRELLDQQRKFKAALHPNLIPSQPPEEGHHPDLRSALGSMHAKQNIQEASLRKEMQGAVRPLCDGFPERLPGPDLGLHLRQGTRVYPINSSMLDAVEMTWQEALDVAWDNLKRRTGAKLSVGRVPSYHPTDMPYDLNITQPSDCSSKIVIATFGACSKKAVKRDGGSLDAYASTRILLEGVPEQVAAALGSPMTQVLFVVSHSHMLSACMPLFATRCDNMQTIVAIQGIVEMQSKASQKLSAIRATSQRCVLSCTPLLVSLSPEGEVQLRPYPALACQHAVKMGEVTYMPWPANFAQCEALLEHGSPIVLQASAAEGGAVGLPLVAVEKACYHCGSRGGDDGKLARCSKCKHALFCGKECLIKGWPLHKPFCRRYKALYAPEA